MAFSRTRGCACDRNHLLPTHLAVDAGQTLFSAERALRLSITAPFGERARVALQSHHENTCRGKQGRRQRHSTDARPRRREVNPGAERRSCARSHPGSQPTAHETRHSTTGLIRRRVALTDKTDTRRIFEKARLRAETTLPPRPPQDLRHPWILEGPAGSNCPPFLPPSPSLFLPSWGHKRVFLVRGVGGSASNSRPFRARVPSSSPTFEAWAWWKRSSPGARRWLGVAPLLALAPSLVGLVAAPWLFSGLIHTFGVIWSLLRAENGATPHGVCQFFFFSVSLQIALSVLCCSLKPETSSLFSPPPNFRRLSNNPSFRFDFFLFTHLPLPRSPPAGSGRGQAAFAQAHTVLCACRKGGAESLRS